jgi:hypothetical protein
MTSVIISISIVFGIADLFAGFFDLGLLRVKVLLFVSLCDLYILS